MIVFLKWKFKMEKVLLREIPINSRKIIIRLKLCRELIFIGRQRINFRR
nr:MAG TPA: hypothetical protein [Caudoviricetes sp.]